MNNNKYYRIVKNTNSIGRSEYVVKAAESWIDTMFGVWTTYELKHKTYASAKEHIDSLKSRRTVKSKVVYKEKV